MRDFIVIGGGIAGLSFGYFINNKTTILEKNSTLGGLSRSYDFNGVSYDIGPHIIFQNMRKY